MHYFAYSQREFVYKHVVMLSDLDQFKHMSFANYARLMFLAGDALFVSLQTEEFLSKNEFRLKQSRIQFKRQTVVGNSILIKLNTTDIEGSEFSLISTYVLEGSGDLVALGKQTYEIVEPRSGKRLAITSAIRNVLAPINVDESFLLYKY